VHINDFESLLRKKGLRKKLMRQMDWTFRIRGTDGHPTAEYRSSR